ncbi:hypothetical protein [Hyalangium versicolor]|uniref:hypothetical protein n=1 Tax=Hyalangium versicolor TaxID=2861190 RepID=UPI001CC92C75|nr:hypothetical protein [Hyalangium versicolor]
MVQFKRSARVREPVPCAACRMDTCRDAPLEMPVAKAGGWTSCVHCKTGLLETALYCHHCEKYQKEPFER